MKLFLLSFLFLFAVSLNSGENNYPMIRHDSWGGPNIRRFEDKGNICYVASNSHSGGVSTSIFCLKASQ